ncbi:unnamed protein product, partial [Iphiclides podalirius]
MRNLKSPPTQKSLQANLHRSKAATAELLQAALDKRVSVALVQEPYVGRNGVIKQHPGIRVIQCTLNRRKPVKAAVIVFGNQLRVIHDPQLVTETEAASSWLYGVLFRRNKEAAFSNYRLWESAGFVVAYAYSTHLCARMKLYVMMVVLLIGFIGYIIVEILHKRKARRLKAIAENPVAAAEAAKQPPEEDDEKDEIDDDIIITHL